MTLPCKILLNLFIFVNKAMLFFGQLLRYSHSFNVTVMLVFGLLSYVLYEANVALFRHTSFCFFAGALCPFSESFPFL